MNHGIRLPSSITDSSTEAIESVEINRSGDECYFISVISDLTCGDKTISKDKIIKLSSSSVTVTAETDTILLKIYR